MWFQFALISALQLLGADAFTPGIMAARKTTRTVMPSSPESDIDPDPEMTQKRIAEMVAENKVLLFMKGEKTFPQCGFSDTAVQVLTALEAEFEVFDVFSDEYVRQGIKTFSDWPTIPQLYINGEFVGGTDIMIEMYKSGEMKESIDAANAV